MTFISPSTHTVHIFPFKHLVVTPSWRVMISNKITWKFQKQITKKLGLGLTSRNTDLIFWNEIPLSVFLKCFPGDSEEQLELQKLLYGYRPKSLRWAVQSCPCLLLSALPLPHPHPLFSSHAGLLSVPQNHHTPSCLRIGPLSRVIL